MVVMALGMNRLLLEGMYVMTTLWLMQVCFFEQHQLPVWACWQREIGRGWNDLK